MDIDCPQALPFDWESYLGPGGSQAERDIIGRAREMAYAGDAAAQHQLGCIEGLLGEELSQRTWFRLSALQGYMPAQHDLAELLIAWAPLGDEADARYGRALNKSAVQGGYLPARRALALSYETGCGYADSQDIDRAQALLLAAAEEGCRYSAFDYARIVLERNESEELVLAAFAWLKKAARFGIPDAQRLLSRVYAGGHSCLPLSVKLAHYWLARSEETSTISVKGAAWLIEHFGY